MINYDLNKIKAIIFDVDGVLSRQTITLSSAGEPLRTVNIKDGYAIQLAQKKGVRIVILTGGNSHAIQVRYENLGVEDIFMGCSVKIKTYEEFKQKYSITDEEIIYVGDDIYEVYDTELDSDTQCIITKVNENEYQYQLIINLN